MIESDSGTAKFDICLNQERLVGLGQEQFLWGSETEQRGGNTKILKSGGQAGSKGGCLKEGVGGSGAGTP